MNKRTGLALICVILMLAGGLTGCAVLLPQGGAEPPVVTGEPEETPLRADEEEARRQAEAELEAQLAPKRAALLAQSRALLRGYFYEEAAELLRSDVTLINDETKQLEAEIAQAVDQLVLYEGTVRHIFFHSLILYPEYLFPDLSTPTGGYNEGFAFQSELERILPQLLERGYVLYNINDVFGKDEDGAMTQKDIYLPPGKMPLILSIDDPSYHYEIGFAHRMILDEDGTLATEVVTPSGELIVTYDGDVELMVNSFVAEHPEFSYRGHKGIIASTGYLGIFGYDLETEASIRDATAVCDELKENGWIFASHSHSHNRNGFWGPDTKVGNIQWDTRRWKEKIGPVVGPTNIFVAPFGYTLKGEAMDVILDNGFDIYCSVVSEYKTAVYPRYALMGRIEIGGYSLVRYTDILNRDFFDADAVRDPHRPPTLN